MSIVAAPVRSPGLISVGYEGRSIDELLGMLQAHEVSVLMDVRLNAISRKPGLSKRRLEASLASVGIAYRHARALGNPQGNREPFRTGRTAVGVASFRAEMATTAGAGELRWLSEALASERVAVLCFEREHERCHRQAVVDAASEKAPGVPVLRLH